MRLHFACAVAIFSLLAGAASPVAVPGVDEPACTRVLPGPTFPRVIVEPGSSVAAREQEVQPDESFVTTLDGRQVIVLQTLNLDLDGDGRRFEIVQVEGFWAGFWYLLPFPRALHRVPYRGAPYSLWSQQLPPGLVGQAVAGDIDRDGMYDLRFEITDVGYFYFIYPGGFQILWGNGDGPLTVGQRSHSSLRFDRLEDVDGDGLDDLRVTGNTYYAGVSPREFDEGIVYTPLAEDVFRDEPYTWLQIGDVDEDGLDDAVAMTAFDFTDTLAISNGDGTFETRPLEKPDPYSWPIVLHDVDGDGHHDLVARTFYREVPAGFYVAWGRGDATFEPYRFFEAPGWPGSFLFPDVDGDGREELFLDGVGTAFMSGRDLERFVPFDADPYAIADVDGDGRDDLVARSEDRLNVVWLRSLGDGGFADPLPGLAKPFDRPVRGVDVTDFDLDGRADLFVEASHPATSTRIYVLLRGDGSGLFERVWEGPPLNNLGRKELLADVDADGRPDLLTFEDYPAYDTALVHETLVRRGNGLGFDPPMATTWMSFAGQPGRFRHSGVTDMLRIGSFGNSSDEGTRVIDGIFQLELNPSLGYVLERDQAPPVVEVRLVRLGEESGDTWRVATLPIDDCSSAPRVTDRRIALLDLPFGSLLTYLPAEAEQVVVFEDPTTGRRAAALLGPDMRRIGDRFDEARLRGGFRFEHMQPMELRVSDEFGPPAPGVPGAREVQRFTFDGDRLVGASVSRPGADLTFVMLAEDGVQIAPSTARFSELLPPLATDSLDTPTSPPVVREAGQVVGN